LTKVGRKKKRKREKMTKALRGRELDRKEK
jgi:hypothetical protein